MVFAETLFLPSPLPLQATFLVPICRSSDFFKRSPRNYCLTLSLRLDDRVLLPLKQCCHVFAVVSWFELFLVQHMPPLLPSLTTKPMTRRDGEEPGWDPPLVTEAISVSSNTEPECITHLCLAVSLPCRFHACHRKKVGLVQAEVSVVTCGHAEDLSSLW